VVVRHILLLKISIQANQKPRKLATTDWWLCTARFHIQSISPKMLAEIHGSNSCFSSSTPLTCAFVTMEFELTIAICASFNSDEYNQKDKTSRVWSTLWRPAAFRNFHKKNNKTHMDLRMNFYGPASTTNPVKSSKDPASLVACTRKKNFWLGSADFWWVTS